MTTGTEGLRERKKRRTRHALHDAALRLFAERGFEATTVAEIAAAADVSPRTFFGYFPSKEDVVFVAHDETIERLEDLLARRDPGETAIDVLRAWIAELAVAPPIPPEQERIIGRLVTGHPAIAARRLALLHRLEDALAAALAADIGARGHPLHARMVAAAAVAMLGAIDESGGDPRRAELDDEQATTILEQAFAFLDAGLAAWE